LVAGYTSFVEADLPSERYLFLVEAYLPSKEYLSLTEAYTPSKQSLFLMEGYMPLKECLFLMEVDALYYLEYRDELHASGHVSEVVYGTLPTDHEIHPTHFSNDSDSVQFG